MQAFENEIRCQTKFYHAKISGRQGLKRPFCSRISPGNGRKKKEIIRVIYAVYIFKIGAVSFFLFFSNSLKYFPSRSGETVRLFSFLLLLKSIFVLVETTS